ncbi:restriction endonuclease subunit S [Microscilla marina]|uniref:Type I restriction-modification system specificity subunit n=1 Tax=Microscilla marina ATCC 23134 TaxID=313606 RepID=A1ZUE4_MICM2|nr:restriction endonuclease subunit S [Microscilla marina]EAY25963.1 type I restriction-modification system specificity subunit [Microscilla marina ATCC 23134]
MKRAGYKDSPLGEIPEDWEVVKLGDIAKVSAGGTPLRSKQEEYFTNGHIPWVKTLDLNNSIIEDTEEKITSLALKETSCNLLPKNTVLVAMYGGFNQIGRTGLLKIEATTNQAISALNIKSDNIYPEFILAWLNAKVEVWKKFAASSRKDPNITKKDVEHFPIVIPPLAEQQEIADILSTVDEKIATIDERLAHTQQLKKGLMQRLFTRGLGHTSFKASPLGEIPESWEVVKLGDIAKVSAGGTPLRSKQEEYFTNGHIPWVKTLDLNNSIIEDTEEKITSLALKETSCNLLPKNTVLVAMYGGFNQIGRTGLLKIEATTNQAISALNIKSDNIYPEFILAWLNAKVEVWKKFAASSRKDPNITKKDVEHFPIVIPPLAEQQEIADILGGVDEKLELLAEKKEAYQGLKKGLMQQLLTGKVRVG